MQITHANKEAEGGMAGGPGELTVQNLIVPGVGDKAAAVLGPIQVGDKTGMALWGKEEVELELEGAGLDQLERMAKNTEVR